MLNNIEINYCHVIVLEVKLNQYNLVKYVVETTLKLRPGLRPVHMTLYLPARTIVTLFQEFFYRTLLRLSVYLSNFLIA